MSRVDSHDRDDPAWRERLTAYLDGELSPAEAREVQAWLEAHPAALRALEEDRRVWSLLAAYRDEGVPAGFSDRVLSNTGARDVRNAWRRRRRRRRRFGRRRGAAHAPLRRPRAALRGDGRDGGPRGRRRRVRREPSRASPETGASPGLASSALDAVPAALLDTEDAVTKLASLSDDEFDALLQDDPEKLAQAIK